MQTTGNLFLLAQKQLEEERGRGTRHSYSFKDVVKYAIKIRRWLDIHNTKEKVNKAVYGKKIARREAYLRTGY